MVRECNRVRGICLGGGARTSVSNIAQFSFRGVSYFCPMPQQDPHSDLKRLRNELTKILEDSVFLGMTPAESDRKIRLISELEIQLSADAAEQRSQWNKSSKTDNSQDARQPGREHDPPQAFSDSQTQGRDKERRSKTK